MAGGKRPGGGSRGKKREPTGMEPLWPGSACKKRPPCSRPVAQGRRQRLQTAFRFPPGETRPKERARIMAARILSRDINPILRETARNRRLEWHKLEVLENEARRVLGIYGKKSFTAGIANSFLQMVSEFARFI